MNPRTLLSAISTQWDAEIVPQLTDYVRIPAKSPHFDPQWESNGYIERAIRLAEAWVKKQPVRDLAAGRFSLRRSFLSRRRFFLGRGFLFGYLCAGTASLGKPDRDRLFPARDLLL